MTGARQVTTGAIGPRRTTALNPRVVKHLGHGRSLARVGGGATGQRAILGRTRPIYFFVARLPHKPSPSVLEPPAAYHVGALSIKDPCQSHRIVGGIAEEE